MPRREEQIGAKGEEKRPPSSGDASPHPFAVIGGAHLSHDSLVLSRNDPRRNVVQVSVNAIKQPAGGLPSKKIGIRFQGRGTQEFIANLNALNDGYRYRLPTEAEWEYACRAGTTGDYGGTGNLDEMGWFNANSNAKTHVGGTKIPNLWGLYDMHGNVWEWVQDWFDQDYYWKSPLVDPPGPTLPPYPPERVIRSGSWIHATRCRSAFRYFDPDGFGANFYIGFRLLRTTQ